MKLRFWFDDMGLSISDFIWGEWPCFQQFSPLNQTLSLRDGINMQGVGSALSCYSQVLSLCCLSVQCSQVMTLGAPSLT